MGTFTFDRAAGTGSQMFREAGVGDAKRKGLSLQF